MAEAARLIREQGYGLVQPDLLGLPEPPLVLDVEALVEALQAALLEGDGFRVHGLVVSRYLAGDESAAICDNLIAPAMERIGELWKDSDEGILLEHRATDLCVQALSRLRGILPRPRRTDPLAIGGAPSGDPYLLPSLMASVVLAGSGWRVDNFGPETPLASLGQCAAGTGAELVWLSFTSYGNAQRVLPEVRELAEGLRRSGIALIVGGQAWPRSPHFRTTTTTFGRSMRELFAFAQGIRLKRNLAEPRSDDDHASGGTS
ncbi:B12-binding domain-containing protein [bacterium]|nr:B12-binding domain-containing protein [bacterium]